MRTNTTQQPTLQKSDLDFARHHGLTLQELVEHLQQMGQEAEEALLHEIEETLRAEQQEALAQQDAHAAID